MSWVKWDDCLLPYDSGGLNIGSLRGKNLTLLGKWFWRAKTEPNSFWVTIIKSIYGANGLLPPTGLNGPKGQKFTRLFHLEEEPNIRVRDRVTWIDRDAIFTENWRRTPSGRTLDDLNSLKALLNAYVKQDKTMDSWVCNLAGNGLFTTKKLATIIDDKLICTGSSSNEEFMKNHLLPIKVSIFIWRVLRRRIPVRTELDKRGIDLDSVRCPLCDDDVETIDHTLFFCRHAMEIWDRVYKWWGLGTVSNLRINEAFRGKCNRSLSSLWSSIWQSIEWTCAYLIWNNRNQKVFSNSSWNGPTGLMEIQLKSFEWISCRIRNRKMDWLGWISDPWSCFV
ncbi:uncharacterized protein [Rutidosis leptorrhynchoides]|uniref:uncharacterized protein n=1 Tax=Rutidosis leptorrhynchoides TaxID=125765 RepID=UPI003A99EA18